MASGSTEVASTGVLWSLFTAATASASPVWSVAGRELVEGRCLGDGGFAFVHEARDRSSGEVFAVRKVLCQDSERLSAAEAEIALLRRLSAQANIVRFFGGEVLKDSSGATQAVSVFELCPGGTLLARLEAAMKAAVKNGTVDAAARCCLGCLPEADVLAVLDGVARGLRHLHSQVPSVVHYDVKSENILLGSDNLWKLCDFGSASTQTYELSGAVRSVLLEAQEFIHGRITPIYRAPEVADVYLKLAIGPKVDMFALGCVLFATLTGVHPFPLDSSLANIQANYKLLPEVARLYSTALPNWLHRLLAREPKTRLAAHDLCAEIERFREFGEEPPALGKSIVENTGMQINRKDVPVKELAIGATASSFNPWSGPTTAPEASWQAAPWTEPPILPDAPWQAFAEEPTVEKKEAHRLFEEAEARHRLQQTPAVENRSQKVHEVETQEARRLFEEAEQRHRLQQQALEREAAERKTAEQAAKEKSAMEIAAKKAQEQKVAAEKAAAEKEATEKMAREKALAEKIAAEERVVAEKAAAEKAAIDKATEKALADKAAADAIAAKRVRDEKMAAEKAAAEKAAMDKAAEKTLADKAEADAIAAKKASGGVQRRRGFPCLCGQIRTRD